MPGTNINGLFGFIRSISFDLFDICVQQYPCITALHFLQVGVPENCTPYVDANALGFYLKNVLPLVFVKTRKGEILPDTQVAIKYMRENAKEFASTLQMLGDYAHRIFKPDEYDKLRARYPVLVSDVAQPYSSFTNLHMSMGAGCYVMTPPGVATILGLMARSGQMAEPFYLPLCSRERDMSKKEAPLTLHRPMLPQMANGIYSTVTIVTPLPCRNPWPAASIDVVLSSYRQ
jgi:hypothetical protein